MVSERIFSPACGHSREQILCTHSLIPPRHGAIERPAWGGSSEHKGKIMLLRHIQKIVAGSAGNIETTDPPLETSPS